MVSVLELLTSKNNSFLALMVCTILTLYFSQLTGCPSLEPVFFQFANCLHQQEHKERLISPRELQKGKCTMIANIQMNFFSSFWSMYHTYAVYFPQLVGYQPKLWTSSGKLAYQETNKLWICLVAKLHIPRQSGNSWNSFQEQSSKSM